ncbi:MAG: Bug family tripartite tricarboxylate transporter substrate binding protein [Burkholderiales bacterium]
MNIRKIRRYCGLCFAPLLALLLGIEPALAQRYPSKAVTMVVPFPAGGRTDLIGRIVAQHLQGQLNNNTVLILNKPGASGVLGSLEVSQARPDGYTLGFFSTSFVTAQYTVPTPIVIKDYDLLAIVNVDPAAVAVHETAPWKTLAELVDHARKNPERVRIGMIPGASAQIFAGALAKAANLKLIDVPFKGDADGAVALAGGHIEVHVAVPVSYLALVAAKKIRVLAVAAEERSPLYRDIPTFRENGVDVVIGAFHGVYGPRGLPADVRDTMIVALEKAMTSRELVEQMSAAGAGILFRKGEAATAFLAQQDAMYRQVIDDLGMRTVPKK